MNIIQSQIFPPCKPLKKAHIKTLDALIGESLASFDVQAHALARAEVDEAHRARIALVIDAKCQARQENQVFIERLFKKIDLSGSPFNGVDEQTGELIQIDHVKKRAVNDQPIHNRYKLLRTAQSILTGHRTCNCMKAMRDKLEDVTILKHVETGTTSFAGLQTCGSVWACPVCAAKITEKRRVAIKGLNDQHKQLGRYLSFLTFTYPHQSTDNLKDLLVKMRKARAFLKAHRTYKTLCASYGLLGTVRALEVTHGQNGWHPHYHEIFYTTIQPDYDHIKSVLFDVWEKACAKVGLPAPAFDYGVDVQNGDFVEDYIAKFGHEPSREMWTVDQEISKYPTKKSKSRKGRTPFQILEDAEKDVNSALLYQEYVEAFKGERQLRIDPRLIELYQVEDISDETLAEEQTEHAVEVARVSRPVWLKLCQMAHNQVWHMTQFNDFRSVILSQAAVSPEHLLVFINSLFASSRPRCRLDDQSRVVFVQ